MLHPRPKAALKELMAEVCPVDVDQEPLNIPGSGAGAEPAGDAAEAEIDDVPTSGGPRKGRDTKYLRAERERAAIRGRMHAATLARLVCQEGKSLADSAVEMGLSYEYVRHQLWSAVRASKGDFRDQEEREAVIAYLRESLLDNIRKSRPMVAESAAHGAVVCKSVQQLCDMYGLDLRGDGGTDGKMGLEEVAREVAALSPMLAGRLAGLARAAGPVVDAVVLPAAGGAPVVPAGG